MNMYRCRNIAILLVMMLLPISVLGAASFKAVAPKQVIQGNKFSIRFELENAQGSSFQGPEVGGCKFLYGPSQSRMMSSSFINGKSTSSSSESYTMTYRAEKAGKYTVGPASISVGGKIYKTNAFTLEILPPDKSAGNQSQGVQIYDADSQSAGKAVGKMMCLSGLSYRNRRHMNKKVLCVQSNCIQNIISNSLWQHANRHLTDLFHKNFR